MAVGTMTSDFSGHRPAGSDTLDAIKKSMHLDLIVFGVLNLLAVGCVLARNRN